MLLSILSALGGGLLRMLPELFSFMNKKTDNAHELALMDKQIEAERSKGADARATITTQGDIDQMLALLGAQKEALSGQMQKTGFLFVDALNFLVRPLTTYLLLALYIGHKVGGAVLMYQTGTPAAKVFVDIYTGDDFALLSGILGFWFVSRTLSKNNGQV